jgi:RNA polymerase primary sigma factor
VDAYLVSLQHIPLMSEQEERRAAQTIRELEVETWRRALRLVASWERLDTHPAARPLLDRDVRARVTAASGPRGQVPTWVNGSVDQGLERVAVRLRALDGEGALIGDVVARLWAMARNGHARDVPWVRGVHDVDRAYRAALSARNAFLRANLRLVVSVARRFRHRHMALNDLIQEGNLGLMRALHCFDWRKGFRFSSYAHWRIWQAVERSLINKGQAIRVPVHVYRRQRQVEAARRALAAELGRAPADAEIAARLDVPVEDVEDAVRTVTPDPLPLDHPLGAEETRSLADLLCDPDAVGPEAMASQRWDARCVHLALQSLAPLEVEILRRRFGVGGASEETLEEIGHSHGLSRERIRQLEARALDKVRRWCLRRQVSVF